MNPKRPLSADETHPNGAKQPKLEHPEEFSNTVKKRLASSTRTGQACDRCKVRKIRCDGLPGGCSPCLQNNTECFTTDRITGRATSRGYTEELEQQVRDLQHRNRELEQRLRALDVPKITTNLHHSTISQNESPKLQQELATSQLPQSVFKGCGATSVAACMGISSHRSTLGPLRGTSLSLLGIEIDVADFSSEDIDEPTNEEVLSQRRYNKSYQSFLQSIFNVNGGGKKVELPAKPEALSYLERYFRNLNPYVPLLHQPSVTRVFHQIYDDPSFQPSTAETVLVHMILSIMLFQQAVQNSEDLGLASQLNERSNLHYHYSLSTFYNLSLNHSFQDCQALALICSHMRNFPKPGACWIMVDRAMAMALELGLHRSSKNWVDLETPPNLLETEMRKRVFWVLLHFHVNLSGKLGQPMRIRTEDFDCELPKYLSDESLEEGCDTPSQDFPHAIGLEAIKLVPLFIDLYSVIYAVHKKQGSYESVVNDLEARLRAWKEALPVKLTKAQEDQGFGLYTQMFQLEFRLVLRYPSIWIPGTDEAFNAESMRICVESSRQMLGVVRKIQKIKSLDSTWCNAAVFTLAITTTLIAQWKKREESTSADLAALKEEIDLWLNIMSEVGKFLGLGNRLRETIRKVSDSILGLISRGLVQKATMTSNKARKSLENPPSPRYRRGSTTTHVSAAPRQTFDCSNMALNEKPRSPIITTENHASHVAKSYPTPSPYVGCSENVSSSSLTYSSPHNSHSYSTYNSMQTAPDIPLRSALTTPSSQTLSHHNTTEWHGPTAQNFNSQVWTQWTNPILENVESRDSFSANELTQLGGAELGSSGNSPIDTAIAGINTSSRRNLNVDHGSLGLSNIDPGGSSGLDANDWPINFFMK